MYNLQRTKSSVHVNRIINNNNRNWYSLVLYSLKLKTMNIIYNFEIMNTQEEILNNFL